ncbi:MAG: site-specific integrase [Planctomycetia bacterium]|nr:site-specific integrase [Planctomycetia bacterium]
MRSHIWTTEELARLYTACDSLTGRFRDGLTKSAYARALVRTAYETAVRLGDVAHWRFEDIAPDGSITWTERKTSKERTIVLSPETLAAIDTLRRPGAVLIFGGVLDRSNFCGWFRALVKSAGLSGYFARIRSTRLHDVLSMGRD